MIRLVKILLLICPGGLERLKEQLTLLELEATWIDLSYRLKGWTIKPKHYLLVDRPHLFLQSDLVEETVEEKK